MLAWLQGGYPTGIPLTDRFGVLAVLHRTLTETDVRRVLDQLNSASPELADGTISPDEVSTLIRRVTTEQPTPGEIARVSARLAAAGWPLERTSSPPPAG